jgi:hypothetical protein
MTNDEGTIHLLYSALHQAHKRAPKFWPVPRCTKVLTEIMAGRDFSWRVIGITPLALDAFAAAGFYYKSRSGITRAHLRPRIETVRKLLLPDKPLSESDLLEIWFANDLTVICARGENKNVGVPPYILIDNDDGALFPSRAVRWHHRKKERDYLKELFHEKARHSLVAPSALLNVEKERGNITGRASTYGNTTKFYATDCKLIGSSTSNGRR